MSSNHLFCFVRFVIALAVVVIFCLPAGFADDVDPQAVPTTAREPEPEPVKADYRVGPGDLLSISVWKDDALTATVAVLPDGTISFPLVGSIAAEGRDIHEIKALIVQRLRKYIPEPVLSVSVVKINSLQVYVIGKVNRPGRFELNDHIDVLQALALAGGINPFARESRIRIFRKTKGHTRILPFDYTEVAKGRSLEQNIMLERGDVIVVP